MLKYIYLYIENASIEIVKFSHIIYYQWIKMMHRFKCDNLTNHAREISVREFYRKMVFRNFTYASLLHISASFARTTIAIIDNLNYFRKYSTN